MNNVKPRQANTASEYNYENYSIHPKFKVFHKKKDETILYINILTKELLFVANSTSNEKKAKVKLYYEITPSFVNKTVLDTATASFFVNYAKNQTNLVTYINLKNVNVDSFVVNMYITDVYSNKKSKSYITVNKTSNDNSQYYLSLKKENLKPLFNNYFHQDETVIIRHNKTDLKQMYVKYYDTKFKIPLPPASGLNIVNNGIDPDSVWTIPKKTWQFEFSSPKEGVYRIQADTSINYGITKMNFGKHFPFTKTSEQLIEPLEYIATQYEFDNMKVAENKKLAVDNFWLNITNNNTEKARQLIKIWYTRVTYANLFFTSYKEGWKTDKGMIFVVFGPPLIVKYTDGAERWTYSYKGNAIHFIFVNQYNPVSDNDYTLQRKAEYRSFWYNTIDKWRAGKV